MVNSENISVQDNIQLARSVMSNSLIERESEIDLVLTSLIANENVLLVGPPGVAKTLLFNSLADWIYAPRFYYLLTKFTDPGEIFGPIDIDAMIKEKKTSRMIDGYAPTCSVICFDEIFKASSAILNCTLTILNEKKIKFGLQEIQCPLVQCIGLSNEWPNSDYEGSELNALFDRFLFRKSVQPLSKTGRKELLEKSDNNDDCKAIFTTTISLEEIKQAQQEATQLPITKETKEARWEILTQLNAEGIYPGDRRIKKCAAAARAFAYLHGSDKVLPDHLEILSHILWDDPTEQPGKCEKIVTKIANPLSVRVINLQQQAQDVESQAEEQLKNIQKSYEREGVCKNVLVKLEEIKRDLVILKDDKRKANVLSYVNEAIKTWQYKMLGLNR